MSRVFLSYKNRSKTRLPSCSKNNTRFTRCEVQNLLKPAQDAIQALIQGRATYDEWATAVGAMSISKAIHDIGIIKGLQGHIDAANLALNCAGHRAASTGEWRAPTLTFEERDSLDTIYALYKTQVEQVTFGEYERAFALANSRIRSRGVAVEVKAP